METAAHDEQLAIKLRKFNRLCPITGYKEGAIRKGAAVVVQTDRGLEYGEIAVYPHGLPKTLSRDVKLKKVIRYATDQDIAKAAALPAMEQQAARSAAQKAIEHELAIKILDVEYLFDTNRLAIYYKAQEGKKIKSLRDYTRDISSALKGRVDLKQLSPRDEARMCGGLGPCGKSLCCATWLDRPRHVTVKMAKEQGLPLSPMKTSGMCGRLLCCLDYEYEQPQTNP